MHGYIHKATTGSTLDIMHVLRYIYFFCAIILKPTHRVPKLSNINDIATIAWSRKSVSIIIVY